MKKIVVASDSFKGSLSSMEVACAVESAVISAYPDCSVVKVNVADGGEGTVEAVVEALDGHIVSACVSDPLMRSISASYGIVPSENMAIVEMSAASGLPLLASSERNPSLTSTFGTGELISDALKRGCRKFLVGIGGSATNDAGTGMLEALGFRFLDSEGGILHCCGGNLERIHSVDTSEVSKEALESEFIVACDVDTPFCGPDGAAYVFGPQKGADPSMVASLDRGMRSFAERIREITGKDISAVKGSGAAGGLGGGFLAFLNARLVKGIEMVLDAIAFDDMVSDCDLVITGEGRIDFQTSMGKTAAGVLGRCARFGVPVIAIGGCVSDDIDTAGLGFAGAYPVLNAPMSLETAMDRDVARRNIIRTVTQLMTTLKTFGI